MTTARAMYEAVLIELNKENAPNILLEEFNYFANKAINQYINKRYNIYDINQQTTDDLRVLKATTMLPVKKVNDYNALSLARQATYEVVMPSDYLHILNCICVYKVNKTYKCYNKGDTWRFPATRLTADAYSRVLDNFWNKPDYKRPYYYIHNVNTNTLNPTNPYIDDQTDEKLKYPGIEYTSPNGSGESEIKVGGFTAESRGTDIHSPKKHLPMLFKVLEFTLVEGNKINVLLLNNIPYIVLEDNAWYYLTLNDQLKLQAVQITEFTPPSDKLGFNIANKEVLIEGTSLSDTFKGLDSISFSVVEDILKHPDDYSDDLTNTDALNKQIADDDSLPGVIKLDGNNYSNRQRSAGIRYGNKSQVRLEIRYGTDNTVFELQSVYIDYIKAPQNIRLTQEQIDWTEDRSQMLEFPDYVCQEIVNELVNLIMENISDLRLLTHPVVSLSIANPAQQLAAEQQA